MQTNLFLRWAILAASVVLSALVVRAIGQPFLVRLESLSDVLVLFVGVAVLALVNATLGTLLKFLTAPMNCLTLGLISLIINALLFWWVGNLGLGFYVGSFLAAFLGSIGVSVINGLLGGLILKDRDGGEK